MTTIITTAEIEALREWMRWPDDAPSVSLVDVAAWVNQRPVVVLERLLAAIDAQREEIDDLRAALIEARNALGGGMNTQGLHCQIAAALKEPRHD